jgi:hypothetical protein
VRKLKNSKRDENDILKFDFKIEWACDVGTKSDLERIACSIAIERLRVLTQPRSKCDMPAVSIQRPIMTSKADPQLDHDQPVAGCTAWGGKGGSQPGPSPEDPHLRLLKGNLGKRPARASHPSLHVRSNAPGPPEHLTGVAFVFAFSRCNSPNVPEC